MRVSLFFRKKMEFLSSLVGGDAPIIWQNLFFYFFIITLVWGSGSIAYLLKKLDNKNKENKQLQQQHTAKIDTIRKDHNETVDCLHNQMLQKEEERTRQWIESEKETLHVLNGVSSLLELSENIGRVESQKILSKLDEIKTLVTKTKAFIQSDSVSFDVVSESVSQKTLSE